MSVYQYIENLLEKRNLSEKAKKEHRVIKQNTDFDS